MQQRIGVWFSERNRLQIAPGQNSRGLERDTNSPQEMKLVTLFSLGCPSSTAAIAQAAQRQCSALVPARDFAVLLVVLLLIYVPGAHAHHASDSYLSLKIEGQRLTGQWDIALPDLERVIGLDTDEDGNITPSEVAAKRTEIERYGLSRLHLELDGAECPLKITGQLVDTFSDGAYNVLRFDADCAAAPKDLKIDYRALFDIDVQHRGLLRLECGARVQTAVFSPEKPAQQFELTAPSRARQFFAFVNDGT